MTVPSYRQLLANGELQRRSDALWARLENCVLCPHQCQVNRLRGEQGYCRTLRHAVVSDAGAHYGEERVLVGKYGSGTIFFSHCNLRCVFCQNYQISQCGEGQEVDSRQLARLMLQLQSLRCHNINLVSPSHIVPQIVKAVMIAARQGLRIPIVYNSNGYDLSDTLKYLDGIVDIYMPDIKFAGDATGKMFLGVKQYFTTASSAVREMYRQVGELAIDEDGIARRGLLVRHLVMPENLAGSDTIMRFIAKEISPNTYVNLMAQYTPAYRAYRFPVIRRRISHSEYLNAVEAAREAGLTRVEATW